MKKFLLLMVHGMITVCFVSCAAEVSDVEENSENIVNLNVWHQWTNESNQLKSLYEAAVAEYKAMNPNITITTKTLSTEAYKTKIAAEFAGTADSIDIFYYWGAGTAKKLVDANKLLPLDEYITDLTKILPGAISAFEFDNKIYSLPSFSWVMSLYANTELFAKADAQLPATYDQLLVACEKLKTLEGVTPIASGAKDGWDAAFIYQALVMREVGAANVNSMLKSEATFGDDPGYAEAAAKVVELVEMEAFGENPLENGYDAANIAFMNGEAAMRITGSWFANQVYLNEESQINPDKIIALDIPIIEGKGEKSDYVGGFIESFWVNKNTKHKEEAAKFAIYINEQMGIAAYETGAGFSGWDVEMDERNLNPLLIQIKDLLAEYKTGVFAWDTALESAAAMVHNEQVQTLFGSDASVAEFIEEHRDLLNK